MHRIVLLLVFSLVLTACSEHAPSSHAEKTPTVDTSEAEATDSATSPQVSPDMHTSQIALDWAGSYSGLLPCADCEGIATEITLNSDGTFSRRQVWQGESVVPEVDEGTFVWSDDGRRVTLGEGEGRRSYQVGEYRLFHLDTNDQRITGGMADLYVLEQHIADPELESYRWVLTEFRGEPPSLSEDAREVFLLFDPEEDRVSGNTSCNNFFGSYAIKTGSRLSFGPNLGMTMMACPDMNMEQAFTDMLVQVDNYAVTDGILSLHRARGAPLARFEPRPREDGNP